ncbi:FAD/NAD(P)-binding protein [Paenibacillus kribbensis]|uniref:FAD/NAD(P)-binding protein n=1 Tax=Paenibacillus kribbensis TaxID=172713 RepID=UPI0015BFAF1C|nr:FAD/NAD(P)-binding protein [Paenibacillus kribbensis]
MYTKEIGICIIGLGSRGLTVLERILGYAVEYKSVTVNIYTVDPLEPGVGVHFTDQPDYLLLNSVCDQLTIFPDESMIQEQPFMSGPNLYEWVHQEGYMIAEDGYTLNKNTGREVCKNDFLPRRILGEYLHWAYKMFVTNMPNNVVYQHYKCEALDICKVDDTRERVELTNGEIIIVDGVYLTTGHTENKHNESPSWLIIKNEPTPINEIVF